ncbi:hypothetical protein [Aneurinibacillus terranovensis]|uniref:hypothetical protein n=1 Tax=Aneurinibacillus terranovensis TaxID=278991 RepID=UPI000400B0E4|nr:hypothetical protein [Aneurinibacillus terranovensis]
MDIRYICRVNENGEILLPKEIQEKLGYGRIGVELVKGQMKLKKSNPDFTVTWTPSRNKRGDT